MNGTAGGMAPGLRSVEDWPLVSGPVHRIAQLLPGAEAALEREHVGEAGLQERERRTGARVLGRSRAVRDDGL